MRALVRRFARDPAGSLTVEAVLILPVLIWGALATLTFVDAFRHQTTNLRTTYAIADLISRQTENVDAAFFAGTQRIFDYLTYEGDTDLRVSLFIWNDDRRAYDFQWSCSTSQAHPDLTPATAGDVTSVIPQISSSKSAILVETWADYTPPFRVGIDAQTFANHAVTSPRFAPQLKRDQCR